MTALIAPDALAIQGCKSRLKEIAQGQCKMGIKAAEGVWGGADASA
jgi:hypothetical protein